MKKEFISGAFADTYYQAAMAGRDMRRVADQLENLRVSIEEKPLYHAWRDVDRAVGQALILDNQELFDILDNFRAVFVDWAFEGAREQAAGGWEAFLRTYVEALVYWRHQLYSRLPDEPDEDKLSESQKDLLKRIKTATPYMLEARWDLVYDLFCELAALPFIETEHRIHLLCSAGQIEMYFFSQSDKAKALFEQAREEGAKEGVEYSRVEQSFGELHLLEWRFDEARNAFQKASMLDPQNEFALLYMGDSYKEEGRYSVAEAWYEDARALLPGNTDVESRMMRLFEKRDYFKENNPEKIRFHCERIGKMAPLEKYSALVDAGFAFQSNDRFDDAEAYFREAIALNPERGNAWVNLGYVLEKKGLNEASEKAFFHALELDPHHFDAQWGLAFLYERMDGRGEEAIQSLQTCLALRPVWEVYILPRISALHWQAGREEEANQVLFSCLEKFPEQDAEPLRILHERVNLLADSEAGEKKAIALLERTLAVRGEVYTDNFANRAGNVKYQFQKFDEAAAFYRQAIGVNPEVPIYHYNLGLAMERLERLEEAEVAFEKYLSFETPTAENLNTIGVFYYKKRQQNERAAALYRQAIELDASNDNYHYNLALALERLERYSEAEAAYRRAIECDPEDPENYNGLGVFYFGRQLYDQSVEHYRKAISLNAGEALYHANLALALQSLGLEEELDAFRKAASLNPKYFLDLGRACFVRNDFPGALDAFEKGLDLMPHYPFNYAYYGLTYENLGQPEKAEKIFLEAIGKDPSLDDYFYNRLGVFYFSRQDNEKAISFYRKAIDLNASNALYHNNLALALDSAGAAAEAEKSYLEAIALDPSNSTFPNFLGVLYFRSERYEQAITYFEKAVALDPANGLFYQNLAMAFERLGDYENADKFYLKSHQTEPESSAFVNIYGLFFYNRENYLQAVYWFRKAAEMDPENALFHCNLGLAHLNLKQGKEAAVCFRKALELTPGNPDYEYYLELADLLDT